MNTESHRSVSLGWFFGLAMILHSLLPLLKFSELSKMVQTSSSNVAEPIEIDRVPSEKRKPVVQTSKAKDQDETQSQAEYAGEFRNRVSKQTQSRLIGPFQEGQAMRGDGKDGAPKAGTQNPQLSENGTEEVDPSENEESEALGGGPKISDLMVLGRSPHYLSDKIEKGNQTVLNTDKVLYASFINRIAEEIYQPWVGNIEEALSSFKAVGKKLESRTYVTKLNVSMDNHGEISGIQIISSCGVSVLDEAPKRAFWDKATFPNPPSQLIEEDGYIRLVYEFHFEYKSSGFNILPMTI